jgi:cytochrome c-type biogenesis protein
MESINVSVGFAFLAGMASFLSPCVFSLVPAYIGYLGGRSVASGSKGLVNTLLTLSHGFAFILGFSTVFVLLGVATSAIGRLLYDFSIWLARLGGVVVVLFGLHMTGIIRIPFLEYDLRPKALPDRKWGYLSSFFMGVFFSAGWSPCVGPILGAILTLSLNGGQIGQGAILLSAYSAGLGILFLWAALFTGLVTTLLREFNKAMHYIEMGMGFVMIIVGILLVLGRYEQIARFGSFFGAIDELMVGRILLFVFITALFLGLIPAYLAFRKGKNFLEWWIFGAGLFPLALPASIAIKASSQPDPQRLEAMKP